MSEENWLSDKVGVLWLTHDYPFQEGKRYISEREANIWIRIALRDKAVETGKVK